MNLYQTALNNIKQKAENKKLGKFNGIPFPYSRFSQYIPSIDKEQVIGLTSFSGAGKSRFLRHTFVTHPYEFSLKHNYSIEIDYYCLEDSAEKTFKSILCNYLFTKCGERVSLYDLDSKFKELPSHILKCIVDAEKYLADFCNKVRIKDTFTTPRAIKNDVLRRASEIGTIHTKEHEGKQIIVGYTPKTDVHRLMLFDNLNNLDKDAEHRDKKQAMDEFVGKDCRLLYSKILKGTPVVVHQQALEAEKQQFTSNGGMILEKNKPSLANLGETKEVTRSYHLVLSLFTPHKFKVPNYKGYDITKLKNNFRELEVLKTNDGTDSSICSALFFDGGPEVFWELPHSKDEADKLPRVYEWLDQERNKQKNKHLLF
jgi:hypothetical protein